MARNVVSRQAASELRLAFKDCAAEVNAAPLAHGSKLACIGQVEQFLRWLAGDFAPAIRRAELEFSDPSIVSRRAEELENWLRTMRREGRY